MLSASSVRRYSLLVAATSALVVGACATAAVDDPGSGECADGPCKGDGGARTDARVGKDTGTPEEEEDTGTVEEEDADPPVEEEDADDVDTSAPGDWIDMTNNASGCHEHGGVACGWSATNNGSGSVCACRKGTWAEGWTCEPPTAAVTAGPSCPGVVSDAGTTTDSGTKPDAGTTDAGGWVDMSNNPSACDNHTGTPCGWNPTNNGTGHTCGCRHKTWAYPWTCEPSTVPVDPTCP
jgi:hypothetical protein